MADGNFKADHVQQKNSNTDRWLWDGAGMALNWAEYEQFLQAAIEQLTVGTLHLVVANADAAPDANPDLYLCFQKAPCENRFWAIMNACLALKACDRTGVVAIACVRHGCYAGRLVSGRTAKEC